MGLRHLSTPKGVEKKKGVSTKILCFFILQANFLESGPENETARRTLSLKFITGHNCNIGAKQITITWTQSILQKPTSRNIVENLELFQWQLWH